MGANFDGQLGDGTTNQQSAPEEILSSGVQAISAGSNHSLILKTDGSLWAMGYNYCGQLGDGTTTNRSAPVQILASGVLAIAAGDSHSLILKADGSLWAMGYNVFGQLGDGTTTQRNAPVQILPSGVQSVSAGLYHSLILKTDGSLWAMGNNSCGQLGNGTTYTRLSPVKILSSGVQAIAAGSLHSLVLKTDGTLWAMGDNEYGQLGDGTTTQRTTPQLIAGNVEGIAAGGYHSLIVASGSIGLGLAFTTEPSGLTIAMGSNASFTAAASGTPAPSYQWQVSTSNGGVWTNLTDAAPYSGTATGTLTITGATAAMSGYQYRCLASNSVQSNSASLAATLMIGTSPTLTTQPTAQTVTAGSNTSFTVAASGNPAPTYQWQVSIDGGKTWTNLTETAPYSGTATATLTVTGATTAMDGYEYHCVATNSVGSATSLPSTLTVMALADQAFLQQLFLDVLGRPIDPGALSAYTAALAGGESRSAVLGGLLASTEYSNRQIEPAIRLYYAALARMPDYAGLQNWSNALAAGVLTLTGAADQFAVERGVHPQIWQPGQYRVRSAALPQRARPRGGSGRLGQLGCISQWRSQPRCGAGRFLGVGRVQGQHGQSGGDHPAVLSAVAADADRGGIAELARLPEGLRPDGDACLLKAILRDLQTPTMCRWFSRVSCGGRPMRGR